MKIILGEPERGKGVENIYMIFDMNIILVLQIKF